MILADQLTTGVACTRSQVLKANLTSRFTTVDTELLTSNSARLTYNGTTHLAWTEWSVLVAYLTGVTWLIEHDEVPRPDDVGQHRNPLLFDSTYRRFMS
ncbi:MAG: hypothetical protein ACXAB0_15550 [Candidatus Thorarchaeota archaeon]